MSNLNDAVAHPAMFWPTPRASANENRQTKLTPSQIAGTHGLSLCAAVNLFPTPTARDWRSGKASEATHAKNSRPLSEQIGGSLNPQFVEWLMNWPINWTSMEPLPPATWAAWLKASLIALAASDASETDKSRRN
jgi:hypothetical protein